MLATGALRAGTRLFVAGVRSATVALAHRLRPGPLLVAGAALLLAAAALPSASFAQGAACTIDLLGNRYDVFVIPRVGGLALTMREMNDVKIFRPDTDAIPFATAVGEGAGFAAGYSPEGGVSLFEAPDFGSGGGSAATDIDLEDNVVGWFKASSGSPRRAFLFTAEHVPNLPRFRFLDEIHPAVGDIDDQGSSRAWAVNDAGQILLTDGDGSTKKAFLLQPGGALEPVSEAELDCVELGGGLLDNKGRLALPGVRAGSEGACVVVHTATNDFGTVVGYEVGATPAQHVAIRDGVPLPGGTGARATDVNDDGYVGGFPGLVWTPEGDRFDIGQAIQAECNPQVFGPYLQANGTHASPVYLNNDLWLSTQSLFLRPAVPDIAYGTSGTGFEFFNDGTPEGTGFGARVGNTFQVHFTIENFGRNALHDVVVESTQDPSLFRLVSGPTPPLPASIEPGESFTATSTFLATGPGILLSKTTIRGTDPSGIPYSFPQATVRVLFVGSSGLNAKIRATPSKVEVGDPFTVTVTATNVSARDLEDVAPLGPLVRTGDGEATVEAGPSPASRALLPPGASQDFVYQLEASAGGDLVLRSTLRATDFEGDEVQSEAMCSLGDDAAAALLAVETATDATAPVSETAQATEPVCPAEGGTGVRIDACSLSLTLEADALTYAALAGDAVPPPDTGYKPGMT